MKVSIICGVVLSAMAFNSMAANTAHFVADKDFSTPVCQIENASGHNNQNVNILMNGDLNKNDTNDAEFTITSNAQSVTWSVGSTAVTGLPIYNASVGPGLTDYAHADSSTKSKIHVLANDQLYPLDGGRDNPVTFNGSHVTTLRIQPKLDFSPVDMPNDHAHIEATITLTCS